MSKAVKLTLSEAQKVVKELSSALTKVPSIFSFSETLKFSQVSAPDYETRFRDKIATTYDKCMKEINDYLNIHDDLVKMKTLISDTNAAVGMNGILAELTNIQTKLNFYQKILNTASTTSRRYYGDDEQSAHNPAIPYSVENVDTLYAEVKHEHATITGAPKFDGRLQNKQYRFLLYAENNVQKLYNATVRHRTDLEREREKLNLNTEIAPRLSEASRNVCGI